MMGIRPMLRLATLSALALLAGCARSEEAHYAQTGNVTPPALDNGALADDEDLTVGTWQTSLQADQPVLEFGPVGAPARFSLSCDARRNLLLQYAGTPPTGDLPNLLVTVGSETRRLAVISVTGGAPLLRGALAPNDPFVRVLSAAAARIVVRIGDTPPLVMPSSPTIAVYIQQCVSGQAVPAVPAAAGNGVEPSAAISVTGGNAATTNAQ
jgi:hypothetical protein